MLRKFLVVVPIAVMAIGGSAACATKKFVRTSVGEVNEKVDQYLEAGVKLVWVVDPHFRTIAVYRPDAEPALFNVNQEISAEPHLPGLHVKVAEVFRR